MLNNDQVEAVIKCIKAGGGPKFEFDGASTCDTFNSIIDHLESQRMEASLFGLVDVHADPEPGEFQQMTAEETQRAFVHHAMHWAFQLGVGAALFAVNTDLEGDPDDGDEEPLE